MCVELVGRTDRLWDYSEQMPESKATSYCILIFLPSAYNVCFRDCGKQCYEIVWQLKVWKHKDKEKLSQKNKEGNRNKKEA